MKAYYQDDACTIYHGDCREILPSLPKVDLVLTDPPYGIGKADWDRFISPSEWLNSCRLCAPVVMVFCGVRATFDYPRPDWILCWERLASIQRNGEFKGFNNWEPILFYCDNPASIPNDTISVTNTEHDTGHPTQKPIRLMTRLASMFGGIILDPFMGSGTTLRAAKDLGRKAIGIEIEERYCEIAAKRLAQEVLPLYTTETLP